MKTILVTGAAGQLGQSIRKLAPFYPAFRFVYGDLPELDITDKACVKAWLTKHAPDVIVNCAAYTAVDRAEQDKETARRVNVDGPAVLASCVREAGIRLIHISTDYVFDGRSEAPYTEDDAPAPTSVYGVTKLAGEETVRSAGCDAVVVRTAWLYSEFGRNFMKTMLSLAATHDTVRVVCDQRGTPTYASDLAGALLTIAGVPFTGFSLYHYTNEGVCTWADFAAAIFRMAGLDTQVIPIPTSEYPTPATRPASSWLDKSRIRQAFGIDIPQWEDGLQRALRALQILELSQKEQA
ncbi:MAG: dTDP-4-dehydrorhamnose reductase [Bacteroidales bacterium]|nr:dTDP-4-dehydrorhamnose reductase [Bacteroidales bacterium]